MSKQEEIRDGEISLDNFEMLFETPAEEKEEITQEEKALEQQFQEQEEDTKPKTEEELEEKSTEEVLDKKETEEVKEVLEDKEISSYSKAKVLIERGYLEDIRMITSEGDEEGTPISEIKNLTAAQLEAAIENQEQKKNKERDDNYISKEGLDDHQIRIVNILKNGGSLKEIFTDPDKGIKKPFAGLDMTTPKAQATVLLDDMVNYKGIDQQDALQLIRRKLEKGTLEKEALEVHTKYNSMYQSEILRIEQETINKKKEAQERVKTTRTALSSRLKEAKIKEGLSKKIIDGVTKVTTEGTTEVEKAFKNLLQNPEENYEVLLHILDQKSFNDIYNTKKKTHSTKEVLRFLEATPQKRKQQQQKSDEFLSSFEEEIQDFVKTK